jgi:hypothetical protein
MNTTKVDSTHGIRDTLFDTCAMPGSVNSAAALIPLGLFLLYICLLLFLKVYLITPLIRGQSPAIEIPLRVSPSSVLHHIRFELSLSHTFSIPLK